jgi:hypothetical protein
MQRWLPVGIVGGVLFATNVIARWAVKLFASDDDTGTTAIGLISLVLVAVIMAGAAYLWARRHPTPRVAGGLAVAALLGCLLSVLVGPLFTGTAPLREGLDFFVGYVWRYLGLAVVGGVFGALVATALGQDHKSQSWKRYADQLRAKPRRAVRR